MRRIGLVVVLAVGLTLPTLAAKAQETAKKAHVGVLLLTPRAGAGGTYIEALRGGLRELGYVEGRISCWRSGRQRKAGSSARACGRDSEHSAGCASDAGSEAILTLKRATDVIPIIMATVMDPVALGITPNLAKPGGNLTDWPSCL